MKKKIVEKKVYKSNKKILKWLGLGFILVFLITLFSGPLKDFINNYNLNKWEWHNIDKYSFRIKLPKSYKEIEEKKEDELPGASYISSTQLVSGENAEFESPEVVYYGGNSSNGVSIMVQCLFAEKTTKSLDEIAEGQHVYVRLYYEDDNSISTPETQKMRILDTDAIRTETIISNKKSVRKMINYLVPMDDKEVTITFFGLKENVEESEGQIREIVEKMEKIK